MSDRIPLRSEKTVPSDRVDDDSASGGEPMGSGTSGVRSISKVDFTDGYGVVMQQNDRTCADPASVHKRPVLAPQIAELKRVFVQQQNAVVVADEITLESEVAVFRAPDQEFSGNSDGLS